MMFSALNISGFWKRSGILLLPLLCLSCATSQEDIIYLNDQTTTVKGRVNNVEQSVDTMDARLSSEVEAVRISQADTGIELEKIKSEMQEITGRLEDNRHLIQNVVERDLGKQDALITGIEDLSKRMAILEASINQINSYLQLEPIDSVKEEPAPGEEESINEIPADEGEPISAERDFYDITLATYKEGKYESAIAGFKSFIAKYPKSELADNAQFWVGECYMALRQYDQAILAYQVVIKKYAKGNKVPNAMLRQAIAFSELDDKTSSKLLLKKIIKNYPNSSESKIAKAKLKTLD